MFLQILEPSAFGVRMKPCIYGNILHCATAEANRLSHSNFIHIRSDVESAAKIGKGG